MRPILVQKGKILGGIVLGILWICCFLFIRPTLVIDLGAGSTLNFKLIVIALGLLIIFFYHQLYPSNAETTKLSWLVVGTIAWLALIIFYPFKDTAHDGLGAAGAVAFFTLVGGLGVSLMWVRFFADEITT